MLAVPILMGINRESSTANSSAVQLRTEHRLSGVDATGRVSRSFDRFAQSTTTSPEVAAPPTVPAAAIVATTAPAPTAPPRTAPPRTAPPTTRAAPAPAITAPRPVNQQSGQASWYATQAGGCAHRTLAKGTVLTVTNTATGASVSCRVHDRGPFIDGRVIDLNKAEFAQIADPSQGVINVRLTW